MFWRLSDGAMGFRVSRKEIDILKSHCIYPQAEAAKNDTLESHYFRIPIFNCSKKGNEPEIFSDVQKKQLRHADF